MDDVVIDSTGLAADELQQAIQEIRDPFRRMKILNVSNHRFLISGFSGNRIFDVYGDPGNCFANLLDGPEVNVHGDCEDDICDAMKAGMVTIYGSVGDVACQAMQGGTVLIRGDAGNRTGMQMREYGRARPSLVIGGQTGDFLGEYMAGGTIIVLNSLDTQEPVGFNTGSGMIGGSIYIRGMVDPERVGLNPESWVILNYLSAHHRDNPVDEIFRNMIGRRSQVPIQLLKDALPLDESLRIRQLFYEDVPDLSIRMRKLSDTEVRGAVGNNILEFCKRFSLDPERFLESDYTVVKLVHSSRDNE